ncbi:nucleoside-diphosphate kinase [Catenuloplanes japonicus]|uniref:nucleoside-diphosphate kinase n=1 Tax=Catenuloplanes japonicus TaxID=33876 RepID=UPI00052713AA|nr:nucleoside-diphosphate kinase [Catenuloplanes japonicus]
MNNPVRWERWTVVLLKPDCLRRGLAGDVLDMVRHHLHVVDVRTVLPTEAQIFAHYDDILDRSAVLGRDVPAELRRIYVGRPTGIALAHGPRAARRLRVLLGPTDPAVAPTGTIRGRFGADTLAAAISDGRLVDNLIHSSDTIDAAARDFDIWYGPGHRHLLAPPRSPVPGRAS